jgi:hypothetical protein
MGRTTPLGSSREDNRNTSNPNVKIESAAGNISVDKPPAGEHDSLRRRKGAPLDRLLPRTAEWMATIHANFQPRELARQFPRIANAIAAAWSEPAIGEAYFEELLEGSRRGRRGFPLEVLRELRELRRYYAHVQKKVVLEWKDGKWK